MILITTPTGNVGSRVLRDLAQREHGVLRVIVRHPEKLPPEIRESVEVIAGSHADPATLIRALEGVEAMFWCQPDSITAEDYYGFYRDFASAGCAAIRHQQTPRVVVLSATGGAFNGQAGPITALHQMEDILGRSGAHLRFLRCGSFFENFLWQIDALRNEGTFYYPMAGDVAHPMVASDDIGRRLRVGSREPTGPASTRSRSSDRGISPTMRWGTFSARSWDDRSDTQDSRRTNIGKVSSKSATNRIRRTPSSQCSRPSSKASPRPRRGTH